MTSPTAAVLRGAAEILKRDGWTREGACDAHGRTCAAMAISFATDKFGRDNRPLRDGARHALIRIIGTDAISDWNDAPERTFDQVLAALESAAVAEEGKP